MAGLPICEYGTLCTSKAPASPMLPTPVNSALCGSGDGDTAPVAITADDGYRWWLSMPLPVMPYSEPEPDGCRKCSGGSGGLTS